MVGAVAGLFQMAVGVGTVGFAAPGGPFIVDFRLQALNQFGEILQFAAQVVAGDPLTDGCEASSGIPNLTMSAMLLQDVAISDVQQCGDVWQATQADASRVAWNEAR